MLLSVEKTKHLSVPGVNDYSWVFVDDGTVTDAERQELIESDNSCLELFGYHFIDNYQDLYNAAPTAALKAVAV